MDSHSLFYTHNPDAFTQLGAALHFYGVGLRYAPVPQAARHQAIADKRSVLRPVPA